MQLFGLLVWPVGPESLSGRQGSNMINPGETPG
jgi:hypothetical protein